MISDTNWKLHFPDPNASENELVLYEYFICKRCGERFLDGVNLELLTLHMRTCKRAARPMV